MVDINLTMTAACPPHYWSHGPTVDSYSCMKCRKSIGWNKPGHAEAAAEYAAYFRAPTPNPTPTRELIEAQRTYLIRKGGSWYRPNSQGYTNNAWEAGRYTLEEAIDLTHPNGKNGPRDGLTYVNESDLPATALRNEDRYKAALEALRNLYDETKHLNPISGPAAAAALATGAEHE